MELQNFSGQYMLSGVDRGYEGTANTLQFCLDTIVYMCQEDPQDGYRSAMDVLQTQENVRLKNTFPPMKVTAIYEGTDILSFYDYHTKLLVLRVGTDCVDAYYPEYVAEFFPENLWCNTVQVKGENA